MGVPALGIDISPLAVTVARDRGAAVLQRCVFRPLPLAEGWRTVLLLDGNIGIGGSPTTLLRRIGHLLAPGGRAVVEVDPPGTPTGRMRARVEHGSVRGPWFAWARLAASRVPHVAEAAGFEVAGVWASRGRWFALLDRRLEGSDHASHWYTHDQECVVCSVCSRGEPGADVWAVALAEGA
jgi:SAM-dependent methyltransferase